MKFTKGIIGIEEFTAMNSLTSEVKDKLGKIILDALDKGEMKK